MSQASFLGVRIAGVAAAVPRRYRQLCDDVAIFGQEEVNKVAESTGVKQRHVSSVLCTTDLCYAAAKKLLQESQCPIDSIDALVFVSQTPDYILPASSCCLHERLGMTQNCAAFDINLGCSGYVYGLWIVSGMIASGAVRRALLLVGDTTSRLCSPEDRSVALLFGDAGTATLLERNDDPSPLHFVLGTNGSGQKHLRVEAGGFRTPLSPETQVRTEREGGNRRADADLYMNGAEIFSFTLKAVPALIRQVLELSGKTTETVDALVMHQANRFMLQHLAKRINLPQEKLILALEEYGNTSSASIPLAMVTHLGERLRTESLDLLLAGFGVGYSWAGANLRCGRMTVPELVLVDEPGQREKD